MKGRYLAQALLAAILVHHGLFSKAKGAQPYSLHNITKLVLQEPSIRKAKQAEIHQQLRIPF